MECIHFAEMTGCYKELIIHFINKRDFREALKKLEMIQDPKVRCQQMKTYASILLREAPSETLRALRSEKFSKIKVESLIPAMHGIPRTALSEAREYLTDYCIKLRRSTAKAVHNMALYMLVRHHDSSELIKNLKEQEADKEKGLPIFFEVDYAINICQRKIEQL